MSEPISDHALMRYMERVMGLDLGPIRREIAGIIAPAIKAGATSTTVGKFTYLFRQDAGGPLVLATVIDAHWQARRRTRKTKNNREHGMKQTQQQHSGSLAR